MKTKTLALLLSIVAICVLCIACASPVTVEGTWYSVEDATMHNFKNGEITVAGAVVGQYDNDGDVVVVSFANDASNNKLYITQMDGVEVLADVRTGDGKIFFCRGLENAEAIIKEAAQTKEEMLNGFPDYVGKHLFGEWTPFDDNAEYKKIVITSDGTLNFTKRDGTVWKQKLIFNEDGTFQAANLRMGDNYPRITLYLSDDGTEKDVNKMAVYACSKTYTEEYPALGFYGWTYKKEP